MTATARQNVCLLVCALALVVLGTCELPPDLAGDVKVASTQDTCWVVYNDSEAGTIKKYFDHNSYVRTDEVIYWKLSEWGAYRMNGFVRFQVPGLQSEPVSCTLVYRQRNHFENQGNPLAHLHVTILAHDPKSAPDSVVYDDVAYGTVIAEDDATLDGDWHRVPLNEDGIDYLWNHINGLAFLGWYYPGSTYGTGAQSYGTESEDSRPYIIVYYR